MLRAIYLFIGERIYRYARKRVPVTVIELSSMEVTGPRPGEIWVESISGTTMTIRRGLPETDETAPQPEG